MLRLKSIISILLPMTIAFTPIVQATSDTVTGKAKATTKVKKEQAKSILEKKKKSTKRKSKQLKNMPVNVNTASVKELMMGLKGIGKKKAQAIVDYRNKHGNFKNNQDLLKVKGIGKKILEKNKKRIDLAEMPAM
jgi:competence ComEA-like helix-hairpin-helix protein